MASNLDFRSLTHKAFPDLLDLFAAGEDVQALTEHPGWSHLTRLLDLAVADADAMLDGRLLDSRAAYAQAHGRRGALLAMQEAASAIVAESTRKLAEQRTKHEGAAEPALTGA